MSKTYSNTKNNCYSSTISVQNGLKRQVERLFMLKENLLMVLAYLSKISIIII